MLRKTQSHGKIGEAAVTAKCWMHGIPAYSTGGLRANFAGSDLIVDTLDPRLLIQVKAGYNPAANQVYLTQCQGEEELRSDKFVQTSWCSSISIGRQAVGTITMELSASSI